MTDQATSYVDDGCVVVEGLVSQDGVDWSLLPWAPTKQAAGTDIPTLNNRTTVLVAGTDPYDWQGASATPGAVFLRPYEDVT